MKSVIHYSRLLAFAGLVAITFLGGIDTVNAQTRSRAATVRAERADLSSDKTAAMNRLRRSDRPLRRGMFLGRADRRMAVPRTSVGVVVRTPRKLARQRVWMPFASVGAPGFIVLGRNAFFRVPGTRAYRMVPDGRLQMRLRGNARMGHPGRRAITRPGRGAVDRPGKRAITRPGRGAVDRPSERTGQRNGTRTRNLRLRNRPNDGAS